MKQKLGHLAFALLAMLGVGCSESTPETPTIPSVEVGEVTLSSDETSASVEVIPSANTAELHWTCVEDGGVEYENGTITNEKLTITLPGIKLDTEYTLTVWAKNEAGESEKVVKTFNFKEEEILKELVKIEQVNATSITMAVRVTKSVKCSRFVIGAQKKLMKQVNEDGSSEMVPFFNEKDFIEQAETSIAAEDEFKKGESGDHYKMFCPYLVSAKSGIYSDYEFRYAKYLDREGESAGVEIEAGETYVIAVYALDSEGQGKLYTIEYTAAEKTEVKGAVDIKVEFLDLETSYTEVKARITAGSDCKRVFYGISVPDEYAGAGSPDMEAMSNSKFEELLLQLGLGRSHAYDGPMEVVLKDNIESGVKRVVWAIGIDEQGNIGKVERAYFQAPYYSAKGIGRFTSYNIADAEDKNSVNITLEVDENATAVRFLPFTDNDYQTFRDRIDWLMFLTGTEAMYTEYPVKDGKVEINFAYHPGDREKNQIYYFFAATVDADGNIGRNENIVQKKYGWSKMYWEVPQIESADNALTFDGTGAATVTMKETVIIPDNEWDTPKAKTLFTVTFGANTKAVHYFKFANVKPNPDIEALLKDLCDDKKNKLADKADYSLEASGTLPQNYLTTFYNAYTPDNLDEDYGAAGDCAAFVSEDNDGNFKIVAVYYAGGVKNEKTYNGSLVVK